MLQLLEGRLLVDHLEDLRHVNGVSGKPKKSLQTMPSGHIRSDKVEMCWSVDDVIVLIFKRYRLLRAWMALSLKILMAIA